MEKIDRELLIKEISARLPYGVKAKVYGWDEEKGEVEIPLRIYSINTDGYVYFETNDYNVDYLNVDDCLLYLRPMSSMTDEEKREYESFIGGQKPFDSDFSAYPKEYRFVYEWDVANYVKWLNAHHFDYRGLIPKNLALDCTGLHIYD